MKKILCFSVILIAFSTLVIPTGYGYQELGSNSTIQEDIRYFEDLDIGSNFEFSGNDIIITGNLSIGYNATINGNIRVDGNLTIGSNVDVNGNIDATGDIILGSNPNITGTIRGANIETGYNGDFGAKIYAKKDLESGSNTNFNGGVEILGDVSVGSNSSFYARSKIKGQLTLGYNSDIRGTLYVYKSINTAEASSNISLKGNKIKVVENIKFGSNNNVDTRMYLYGKKLSIGYNYSENIQNYTGFFGEIDPLLNYTLGESEISQLKNKTDIYLQQISENQSSYNILFNYLEPYIENESFDKNTFSNIKQRYIGNTNNVSSDIKTDTTIEYNPFLPIILKERLDEIINNIPENQKIDTLLNINKKINVLVKKLSKKNTNVKNIRKINILLGIQQYIEDIIYQSHQDNTILQEIGL